MILGIPKEILKGENRVAAIPETVEKYIELGFKVIVEDSAGKNVHFTNEDYEKAGAKIVSYAREIFSKADIILKVKEPHMNDTTGIHETELIKPDTTLITFLHPAAPGNHDMVNTLRKKNITAFTMDGIPRTSRAQKMDALTSMSTITGYKSVLMAANRMPRFIPMIGTSIGMIHPAKFIIIGAGVVGLQAIATAKRLGGTVKVIDIRDDARMAAKSLGAKIEGFDAPAELALGQGGYAKSLPPEWLNKERDLLLPHMKEVDVIILCALVPGEIAPKLITDEMVNRMKPGSVIVDVSVDQGGNCTLTNPGCDEIINNVHICGIQNIPGSVPVHSTWLYANNIYYYVENLFKKGIGSFDFDDEIVQHSLVTYQGKLVHAGALKAMKKLS